MYSVDISFHFIIEVHIKQIKDRISPLFLIQIFARFSFVSDKPIRMYSHAQNKI